MSIVNVRPIIKGEEKAASELERVCLDTAWSEAQISSLPEYAVYLAAVSGDMLCGIASAYVIADEVQVMNVAVSPEHRRKGIGKMLMDAVIDTAREKNCAVVTLEVASDNDSAVTLYKKCGFDPVGIRKGFYNGVDAVLMEKTI